MGADDRVQGIGDRQVSQLPHRTKRLCDSSALARRLLGAGYAATTKTGVPTLTWSKSQVASEISIRMQPCEAE